jgi:NADPH:quinone reductase-like Zn-dependent oxidoreductase
MKAVVLDNKKAVLIANRAIPKLRDDYMLVKTVAVALNPTDWKHVLGIFSGAPEDGILGCDYAGIVEEVGKDVTKPFEKGDRVAGCAHGGNWNQVEDGAFAEYIMVKGDLQMKIPDSLSFEKASTIGLGAATVAQGLYQKALGLNLPTNPIKEKTYVLIYGGSTATGTLGIQYAKLYVSPLRLS